MNIAMLHPGLDFRRGAERVVVTLAERLARRGHSVTLFTSRYDTELHGDPRHQGFELVEIGGPGWGAASISEQRRIGRDLTARLEGFDVVNLHGYPANAWLYFGSSRRSSLPPIVWLCNEPSRLLYDSVFNHHSHGLLERHAPRSSSVSMNFVNPGIGVTLRHPGTLLPRPVIRSVQRSIDRRQVQRVGRVVCNSAFAAERIGSIYPWAEIAVCHLGIDPSRYGQLTPPAEHTPSRLIVTASPLHRIKNVESSIRAMALLRDRGQLGDARYVIAGRGPDEARLRSLVAELELRDVVELRGFVSDDELSTLYASADVVLYVPLDEPFGLVFLEAMAVAKPVIGPSHGGATEIVVDGVTGRLVDPLNPERIADAIHEALSDFGRSRRMGEAGYRRFTEHFTAGAFVDRFEPLLRMEET